MANASNATMRMVQGSQTPAAVGAQRGKGFCLWFANRAIATHPTRLPRQIFPNRHSLRIKASLPSDATNPADLVEGDSFRSKTNRALVRWDCWQSSFLSLVWSGPAYC